MEKEKENKDPVRVMECAGGRCFLGRISHGEDLLAAVETLCTDRKLDTAHFSIIGALTEATLGAYDHQQQVYVTFKKKEPLEIVHCTGNVTYKEGKRIVHAHAVLADIEGHCVGGHLFPESFIFAGEIFLRELLGSPLNRIYDDQTGLWLWGDREK